MKSLMRILAVAGVLQGAVGNLCQGQVANVITQGNLPASPLRAGGSELPVGNVIAPGLFVKSSGVYFNPLGGLTLARLRSFNLSPAQPPFGGPQDNGTLIGSDLYNDTGIGSQDYRIGGGRHGRGTAIGVHNNQPGTGAHTVPRLSGAPPLAAWSSANRTGAMLAPAGWSSANRTGATVAPVTWSGAGTGAILAPAGWTSDNGTGATLVPAAWSSANSAAGSGNVEATP